MAVTDGWEPEAAVASADINAPVTARIAPARNIRIRVDRMSGETNRAVLRPLDIEQEANRYRKEGRQRALPLAAACRRHRARRDAPTRPPRGCRSPEQCSPLRSLQPSGDGCLCNPNPTNGLCPRAS